MNHLLQDAVARERLQVFAGFAEADAAQKRLAHAKIAANKMIERDAAGDDVAAHFPGRECRAEFGVQRIDRFAFDESHMAALAGRVGERSVVCGVAVAFEALPRNAARRVHGLHGRLCRRGDVDRDDAGAGHENSSLLRLILGGSENVACILRRHSRCNASIGRDLSGLSQDLATMRAVEHAPQGEVLGNVLKLMLNSRSHE